jgi:hypothetical protein
VTCILRELLVTLNEFTILIINLLDDKQRIFVHIHDFDHTLKPAYSAKPFTPVAATAIWQIFPMSELLLILRTCCHVLPMFLRRVSL